MADSSGAVDLGAPRTEDKPDPGPQPGPEPQRADRVFTAFIVAVGLDGQVSVLAYNHDDLVLEALPNNDSVYGAVSVVQKDIAAQDAAQASIAMQMQQAAQMQQAMEARRMQESLGPNLRV